MFDQPGAAADIGRAAQIAERAERRPGVQQNRAVARVGHQMLGDIADVFESSATNNPSDNWR